MPRGSVAWTARRVHRFNERGPEGLKDSWSKGHPPRLSAGQLAQLAEIVETGPERGVHGVVRWPRVDQQQIVAERCGVAWRSLLAEPTTITIIGHLGWAHVSDTSRARRDNWRDLRRRWVETTMWRGLSR